MQSLVDWGGATVAVCDRDALLARVGGDRELLAELVEIFLEEAPGKLAELKVAVADIDAERVRQLAHYLSGTLSLFGAAQATASARRLEAAGKADDLIDSPSDLAALEWECDRLRPALHSIVHEPSGDELVLEPIRRISVPPADEDNPLTALVVDDSPPDSRFAAAVLRQCTGLRVACVSDGLAALAAIEKQVPAVVLTDLQMPNMNGLALVKAIRDRWPQVPVILMTAYGSEATAAEALRHGAVSYVPKRFLERNLPETLAQVLVAARADRRHQRLLESVTSLDCHYLLPTNPTLVQPLVATIQEQALRLGLCDAHEKIRLGIAVEEALLNGLHHGNLELSSSLREQDGGVYHRLGEERRRQMPYRARQLHVRVQLDPEQAIITVRDEGPGFDLSNVPDPTDPDNLLRPSGRGLLLIRTFMDAVMHNAAGNEITIIKRRKVSATVA